MMRLYLVFFKDGRNAIYTEEVIEMMKSDPDVFAILDNETGEILYNAIKELNFNHESSRTIRQK